MALKAVIFDLDDTLLHGVRPCDGQPADLHYLSWCAVLAEQDLALAPAPYAAHMRGRSNAHCDAYLSKHLGLRPATPLSEAKERYYRDHLLATHLRLRAGAAELLEALAAAGLRLGIATNAPAANVAAACANTPLARWFDTASIVDADLLISRGLALKPAPDGLQLHAARWQLLPAEVLFVGDSSADVAAARGAGMAMLAITAGHDAATLQRLGACDTFDHFDTLHVARLQALVHERAPPAARRPHGGHCP